MPFLMYRDNDLGLWPSSYPYILGRALNHYKIKPAVSICILDYSPSYVDFFILLLKIFIPDMYINIMYLITLFHFEDSFSIFQMTNPIINVSMILNTMWTIWSLKIYFNILSLQYFLVCT